MVIFHGYVSLPEGTSNWWYTYPPAKILISQIGSSSQLLVKIKNVPNHHPVHVPSGNLKVRHGKFAMKVGDFSVKHCHFPWLCLITRGQPGSHWENTYENYDTQTHAHTLDDFGDCKSKKPPFSIGNHLQAHVHCAFSKYHGR